MSLLSQRSLAGGELSPSLYPRTDTSKYSTCLKTQLNTITLRNGGTANRPGTLFVGEAKYPNQTVRMIPFRFSQNDSYILEFGEGYMRVVREGLHVTEFPRTITAATKASPCVVTAPAHSFSEGDEVTFYGISGMVELNNRNFIVSNPTADTFELTYKDGDALNSSSFSAYTSGGSVAKIYEIATPYGETDLRQIQYRQVGDVIFLAHSNHELRQLSRFGDISWTIEIVSLSPSVSPPTITNSGSAGSTYEWVVTSITEDFEESIASNISGTSDTPSGGSPITISWSAVTGAMEYNVFRKHNGIFGLIGTTTSTSFEDSLLDADITECPPEERTLSEEFGTATSKLTDPADLPAGNGKSVAWSPDGNFIAVAHTTTPFITVWARNGTTFTKLSNPSDLPAGNALSCSWSPDGTILAVTHNTSPYLSIYQRAGLSLSKLSNADYIPSAAFTACAFSPDGNYLAAIQATAPLQANANSCVFKRSGTSFTRVYGLVHDGSLGQSCSWVEKETGTYLAVGHRAEPRVTLFRQDGDTFLAVDTISDGATGLDGMTALSAATGVAFSPDGNYLAVTVGDAIRLYDFSESELGASQEIVDTEPAGGGTGVSWSPDGTLLVVTHATSPYVSVYARSGFTLTKLTDPGDLPAGTGRSCGYSPDGTLFAVAHDTSPYLSIFTVTQNNPAVLGMIQQRLALGNTNADPERVWLSRTGNFKNFTVHSPLQDDDSMRFTMQGAGLSVNEIRHIIDAGRFLILTSGGEHRALGDEAEAIRATFGPNQKQFDEIGASTLSPIVANKNVLFTDGVDSIVFNITPDDAVENLTEFADHIVSQKQIVSWDYQKGTRSIVWAVRDDGILCGLTYNRQHEIFAWHRHEFFGEVEDVCVIPEGNRWVPYLVIKSEAERGDKREILRMADRDFSDIKEALFMDNALTYDGRNTNLDSTMDILGTNDLDPGAGPWTNETTLYLSSSAGVFFSSDVGNEIQLTGNDGEEIRFLITHYVGASLVRGTPHKDVPTSLQNQEVSTWARAVDELTGLWHIEGKQVSVFADGFTVASPNNPAYDTITVSNGSITLPRPYGVIHVGLPYISDIETLNIDLPGPTSIANKKKRVNSVLVHVVNTRSLYAGIKPPAEGEDALSGLEESITRELENYDELSELFTGEIEIPISTEWTLNGRVFLRQVDPVPVSVTGISPCGDFSLGGR